MMAFGVNTETAVEMTDRLAIAAAATGGDINNLGRNLGQIAAQGQAYTRDLHQFAMQGLPIWDEMSKVTGRSVVELKKLASEGKISFEIVSAAIKNMTQDGSAFEEVARRMQETFAGRLANIETSFANLSLAVVEAFNQIDAATGGLLTGGMQQFAEFLQGLADGMPAFAEAVIMTFNDIGGVIEFVGGVFETLSSGFQTFLGFVLQLVDPLGIVQGSLTLMGNAAVALYDALKPVETILAFLAGPAIVIGIGLIIKSIYGMMTATYAYIKAQIISLGLMGPKGWAIMAAAGLATAGAYKLMEGNLKKANEEMKKTNAQQGEFVNAAKQTENAQNDIKVAIDNTTESLKEQKAEAKAAADEMKKAYQDQKTVVKELEASIKARYDREIEAARGTREKIKNAMDAEKENYKSMQDAVNARYDAELSRVNQIYDRKLAALDLERDRLGARGPKEQELYMLEKQALEAKIESGKLEGEELLRAEARLERMNRQEQMEKLSAKRKEVEKQKTQAIAAIEKQRETELKKMEERHKNIIKAYETQLKEQDKKIKKLQDEKKEVGQIADNTKAYNGDLQQGVTELGNQVDKMATLKGEWDQAISKVELYNQKLKETPKPKSPSGGGGPTDGSGGGPDGARASGGPVTGGSSYQVNELGKEAFLSAAGKLSMINAPAFGTWKAPSSGTVIPAHLTEKLDVPTGGVNLNSAAGFNGSRAGAGGMSGMVRAIAGAMSSGGDTFNQNVTVQAANPVQAANNMMVEMTRLKRRRFG